MNVQRELNQRMNNLSVDEYKNKYDEGEPDSLTIICNTDKQECRMLFVNCRICKIARRFELSKLMVKHNLDKVPVLLSESQLNNLNECQLILTGLQCALNDSKYTEVFKEDLNKIYNLIYQVMNEENK